MTRAEFAASVRALREDLTTRPDDWENRTLERYLDALPAWPEDSDGYFANRGEPAALVDWRAFADALHAAKTYE